MLVVVFTVNATFAACAYARAAVVLWRELPFAVCAFAQAAALFPAGKVRSVPLAVGEKGAYYV